MRCFLFPHTRFIRCYESLPAYAWKGFLFVRKNIGKQEQFRILALFLIRRERKIKVFPRANGIEGDLPPMLGMGIVHAFFRESKGKGGYILYY